VAIPFPVNCELGAGGAIALTKYDGAQPSRRKAQAEEEICSSKAKAAPECEAQVQNTGCAEEERSAKGTVSGHHGSNGKDSEITAGGPPRLGAKAKTERLGPFVSDVSDHAF
jgi:hypothetical protein